MRHDPEDEHIRDGRRRKGNERRRRLLRATMRVIERDGAAAVTQRAVAKEAELPPSSVTYYFATIDELLTATLTEVNDGYIGSFDGFSGDDDRALEQLAELIAASTDGNSVHVLAEYELFLMAARRPDMRAELARWNRVVETFTARYTADPIARAAIAAAIDGLFLRAAGIDAQCTSAWVLAVLKHLTQRH